MSGFRSLGDHETVEFKASNTDKVKIVSTDYSTYS